MPGWQLMHPLLLPLAGAFAASAAAGSGLTSLARSAEGRYLLFDFPGQVELFTLHSGLRQLLDTMQRAWRLRLTAVQVSVHVCSHGKA